MQIYIQDTAVLKNALGYHYDSNYGYKFNPVTLTSWYY